MRDDVGAAASLVTSATVKEPSPRIPTARLTRLAAGGREMTVTLSATMKAGRSPPRTDRSAGSLALITGEVLEEFGGAGFRYGAQVLDHLVTGHADAVVRKWSTSCSLCPPPVARAAGVVFEQRGIGSATKRSLSAHRRRWRSARAGILLCWVEAVSHQAQQLFDFSLKAVGFGVNTFGSSTNPQNVGLNRFPS